MQAKSTRIIMLLLAGIAALTFVTACASSSPPVSQPVVPSAADKAAMEEKAAMEAKAMAEKKAMEEKAAMEAKAMAEKKAMEEKAAMEAKAMAEKKAMEEKAAMEAKAMAEKKAMEEKAVMEAKAMAEKKAMEEKAAMEKKPGEAMMEKLPDQQFAAHFVDSNPVHGAKLAQVPTTITLNFNFTLTDTSAITVTKDGKQVNSGKPTLSSSKLTMSASLPATAGNGTYSVDYKACWPDGSCHNGKFAFIVGS